MAGRKRAADESSGPTTRAAKAAKTDDGAATASPKGGRKATGKRGLKTNLAASTFKSRALPLHVNVTHTPPVIPDNETASSSTADPGSLGSLTLVPSSFNTGSYGWKGTKRLQVELANPEGGEEKEKVHVMLTINATVMGSKNAGEEEEKEDAKDEEAAKEEEAVADEVKNGDDKAEETLAEAANGSEQSQAE